MPVRRPAKLLRISGIALLAALPLSASPTWKEAAPLLQRHCVECHHPGGPAPFSLLRYQEAAARSRTIAREVLARRMPPWRGRAADVHYMDERVLPPQERLLLQRWAQSGAPQGSRSTDITYTAPPAPPAADLTLPMQHAWTQPAASGDAYRCFVIPTQQSNARYINRFHFLPGNARLVHHAIFFADVRRQARALDAADPLPGYECFGTPGFLPARGIGGWSPGQAQLHLPPHTAVTLPAGSDIVLQLHYQSTGREERDASSLQLWFSEEKPQNVLYDIPLSSNAIDIAAGAARYIVRDEIEVPVAVNAWSIYPHAHLLARRIRGTALLPNGQTLTLLRIEDWNFRWQDAYRFRQPLRLPAGTRLRMEITYDNSAANPQNPSRPPQRVRYGPGVKDEMAGLHLSVTAVNAKDNSELDQLLWSRFMRLRQERSPR
jgi:hypothetical protein